MKKTLLIAIIFAFAANAAADYAVDDIKLEAPEEASIEDGADFKIEAEGTDLTEALLYMDENGDDNFQTYEAYECSGDECTVEETLEHDESGTVRIQAEAYADDIRKDTDIQEVEFKEEPEEFEIENSKAERNEENVDLMLELEEDLPEDYTCRWSEDSEIETTDSTMDRESDKEFEASTEKEDSGSVWMGCIDDSGNSVTETVEETYSEDEGLKIESSSAEQKGDKEAEFKLEFNRDLGEEYSCRWSEDSEIETTDSVMERESDREFEAVEEFDEGEHEIWMGCLIDSERETEKAKEEFEISSEDLEADFSFEPNEPEIDEEVEFDASDSSGEIEEYEWDFDDGETGEGKETSHSFEESGWYDVELTVEDEEEETDTTSKTVQVEGGDDGRLETNIEDDDGDALEDAKITSMALSPAGFGVKDSEKTDSTSEASRDAVGDSEIGFEMEDENITSYAEYTSGYTDASWDIQAFESDDQLIFRYDLAAEERDRFTEYRGEQELELSEGEKEVTTILSLNGEKIDSTTSKVDVPSDGEFAKTRDSSGTSYSGDDRRTGDSPSLPEATEYTNSDGQASFQLPPSSYTVTATKPGYERKSRNVDVKEDKTHTVDFELENLGDDEDDDDGEDNDDDGEDEEESEDEEDEDEEQVDINSIDMPDSVCRGEDLTARVKVENAGSEDLDFAVYGEVFSQNPYGIYYLEPGDTRTAVLTFEQVEELGNERINFSTNYDDEERLVQVRDCDRDEDESFSASLTPTTLRAGDSVRIIGIAEGLRNEEIELTLGGFKQDSITTEPDGRFEDYITAENVGEKEVLLEADGKNFTETINVRPTVDVESIDLPDAAYNDEAFEVCGEVESQTTPLVLLKKDGDIVDTQNNDDRVCFERREEAGTYEYEIQALNQGASNSETEEFEVFEQGPESDSFPDRIASIQSGSGLVRVEVYNNRSEAREYNVALEGLPEGWMDQSENSLELNPGERDTVYFYVSPEAEGSYQATANVEVEGEIVYSENIGVESGGTDRRESLWTRLMQWFRFG